LGIAPWLGILVRCPSSQEKALRPKIPIKLKPKVWRALLKTRTKRLNLDLTLTFFSEGELQYRTASLKVSRARVRQNQGGAAPRHK